MSVPAPHNLLHLLRWNVHRVALVFSVVLAAGALLLGWHVLIPGIIAALLVAISIDGIARPGSSLFHPTVTHGPRNSRWVALTFDDGPDPEVTPAVLDMLKQRGAHATFFVVGQRLEACPELARRLVAEGHSIGNHSWKHSYFQNFYMPRHHAEEIARCEQAIETVTGQPAAPLYRPPVGLKTGELAQAVTARGLTLTTWSVHSRDTLDPDPRRIARRVLRRVKGGDIVLLHDGPGRATCAEAVRLILDGLAARGLECVTLPTLLGQ